MHAFTRRREIAIRILLSGHQLKLLLCLMLPLPHVSYFPRERRNLLVKLASSLGDTNAEATHYFTLAEIKDATNNFERKIDSGGFGVVFYGRLLDGKEIAVKRLTNDSFQGKREFTNEVLLLMRNVTLNLSNPEFEPIKELLSSYDVHVREVQVSPGTMINAE
ncbi:DNA helicase [Salvia divinorum]|uniref:DNA helicase n=1 Tax=Salvia divinorum TaxID=28513 RepID=A0ABD1GSX6_SALDI